MKKSEIYKIKQQILEDISEKISKMRTIVINNETLFKKQSLFKMLANIKF